jgi:hypothetical protein
VQQEHDRRPDASHVALVLVGFSPADRLAVIARAIGWRGEVLADPQRRLYSRLGVGRAPLWRVYTPATLATYARAALGRAGRRPARRLPRRPQEDTRQLGADAVLVDGIVRVLWRPRSPDDRPPASQVVAAAVSVPQG